MNLEIQSPTKVEAPKEVTGDDISEVIEELNLDVILAVESEEQRAHNLKLDALDKAIEERIKVFDLNDAKMDTSIASLKKTIKENERVAKLNKLRASSLSYVGLEEITSFAESSLSHIQRMEDQNLMTPRKKLYFGSAGDQQSLLYSQIWLPFSDNQHGISTPPCFPHA